MRNKTWIGRLVRGFAALMLLGLIVGGGFVVYRIGLRHGYVASESAEGDVEAHTPFMMPHHFVPYGRPFGLARAVFGLIGLMLLFGLIGKLIRTLMWGPHCHFAMHGLWGRPPRSWRHAYHRHAHCHPRHGPVPPWCWDWDAQEDKTEDEPQAT